MNKSVFQRRVLRWFDVHGRKDLPWQINKTAYRVWVSEIMLQQTQVGTVIPYYERFMRRFPTLKALATASQDEVLAQWSGLGYYARARNLQRAALRVIDQHKGRFPKDFAAVCALPGIGRSTAGAILSLAYDLPFPILDGNVKRVLARYFCVEDWPGLTAVQDVLWEYTVALTPAARVADYNQAMMDLGATLCTRSRPRCESCPLTRSCLARQQGRQAELPAKRARKAIPVRTACLLMLVDGQGRVLLQRRPPTGIWGGLWSFPELPSNVSVSDWCKQTLGLRINKQTQWPQRRHTFSHFHLDMTPIVAHAVDSQDRLMDDGAWLWYKKGGQLGGTAAPVQQLLTELHEQFSKGEVYAADDRMCEAG